MNQTHGRPSHASILGDGTASPAQPDDNRAALPGRAALRLTVPRAVVSVLFALRRAPRAYASITSPRACDPSFRHEPSRSNHTVILPMHTPRSTLHTLCSSSGLIAAAPAGRFARALVLFALSIVAASPAALARQGVGGRLSCDLAAKDALTAADETAIKEFVSASAGPFAGENVADSQRARDTLAEPLSCARVTIAFRLKYAEALEPVLSPLAAGTDDRLATNALLMFGKLRTTSSLRPLETALSHSNPVIRFAAASGFRELISQLARDNFGFSEQQLDRLFDTLRDALVKETDPLAAEGLVLALGDATKSSAPLRRRAILRLADAAAKRVATLPASDDSSAWTSTMLRAVDLARQTLFEQAATGVDREFARRAGLLSGYVFAYVRDHASSASADSSLAPLAGAAEGLAVIAHGSVAGQTLAEKGLRQAVEAAAPDRISAAIEPWIGASGLLTQAPYSAPAADFAPKTR